MPDRYPFPEGEDARQTAWWGTLHPVQQKQWFQLLKHMTPGERAGFHAERREVARGFTQAEGTPWRKTVEDDAEARLYRRWADAVRSRLQASRAGVAA